MKKFFVLNIAFYSLLLLLFPAALDFRSDNAIILSLLLILLLLTWFISLYPIAFYIIGFALDEHLLLEDFYVKLLQLLIAIMIYPNFEFLNFWIFEIVLFCLSLLSIYLTVKITDSFASANITIGTVLNRNAMDDKKHALFNKSLEKSLWLIVPPTILAGFWDVVSQDLRLFTACYLTVLLVHFYIIRSLLYSIKAMKQAALSKSFFYVPLFMVDSIAMLYAYHCGLDIVYFIFIGVGFSNVSFAMNYCNKSDHDR